MSELEALRVSHVGPSPEQVGGMETVLRAYRDGVWPGLTNVVIASAVRAAWSRQVATFCRAAVRLVRTPADVRHVHLSHRGSFIREGTLVFISALRGPTFVTIHGSSFVETAKQSALWRWTYRVVLRRAKGIAVLNEPALRVVNSLAPRVAASIVSNPGPVVHPPADPTYVAGGAVVFAGRVGKRKGVDTLLDAWAHVSTRVPDAELVIVGPLENDLDPRAAGLLNGHYRGELSPALVEAALSGAACAVLPSRGEGQPMFLIEALAYGVPLVVSDVGGMPDLAQGNGRVVAVGDHIGLADAISEVLLGEEKTSNMRIAAIEKYARRFSVSAHETALRRLYGATDAAANERK